MTDEQYQRLLPLKPRLRGVKYNSVRLPHEERATAIAVYEEMTGTTVRVSERTCSSCMLRICRTLYNGLLDWEAKNGGNNER